MMKLADLQKIENLRAVWKDEKQDFIPWLARTENLNVLSDVIGLEIEIEARAPVKDIEPFWADILCRDTATGNRVLIKAQLEKTDNAQMGRLMAYAAGLQTVTIVWIAREFSESHRAALDWLNVITNANYHFFGLEIELWRIGASPVAPKFNIVCKPNPWTRHNRPARTCGLTDNQLRQLEFWTEFAKYLEERGHRYAAIPKPQPQNWMSFSVHRSGFSISTVASAWDTVKNTFGGELRVELVLSYQDSKAYFRELRKQSVDIAKALGEESLTWAEKENVSMCRVYVRRDVGDIFDRSQWPDYKQWLHERLIRFQDVFRPIVARLELPNPWDVQA